jgi:hypothetical protein
MWQMPIIVVVLASTAVPVGFRSPVHFTPGFDDPLDAVENVLGYVPIGIVLGWLGPLWTVAAAAGMSVFAETFQTVMQHRDPSVSDIVTNVIGAILGIAIRSRWAIHSPCLAVNWRTSLLAVTTAATLALGVWVNSGAPTNPRGVTEPGRLESYWKLDETDGRFVSDSSGNGLNGKFRYEPTHSASANGVAANFDGKRDFIDFGKASAFRATGSMTISAWIQPTSFPKDDAAIVSTRNRDELGYQLDATVDQGPRTIGFKLADPCGHLMARYGKTVLKTGTWYHVAGVYDATAKTIDVYVNGEPDNGLLIGKVAGRQLSAREPLYVGKRNGADGFEFAGSIDDVRIYSVALTREEIASNMKGATGNSKTPSQANLTALPETTRIGCSGMSDPEDARIPGIVAAVGVLVAIACASLWPSAKPFVLPLASFAAGLAFFPILTSTIPPLSMWIMPFMSLTGGVAVAVSTRRLQPYQDSHSK